MYEDIDIRPYLNTLLKKWPWLIATAVFMAIAAFGGTRLIPLRYETTALVIVNDQADLLRFDNRIISDNDTRQLLNAYPELATSDVVVGGLLERMTLPDTTLTELQKSLTAQTASDPRLIQLIVEDQDPETAAQIANIWADELIEWTNLLYNTQSDEALTFYENELTTAESALQAADNALIEFEAVNRTAVLSNTLQSLYQTQTDTLLQLTELNQIADDVASMQTFLLDNPATASITFSDQLTLLALQTQIFNASASPIILQLSPETNLSESNRNDQLALLNRLADIVAEQKATVDLTAKSLEPEILLLQQEIQEAIAEQNRLSRNQLVAEENYLSLARKVSEERILSQDTTPPLRLISEAIVPDKPINQSTISTVAVAIVLGFSLSSAFVLFQYWWKTSA